MPLRVEGRARNLRGPHPARRPASREDGRKKEQGKGVKRRELSWHLLCAHLLYTFKAARLAARAANSARTPSLPRALPLRRRQRAAGRKPETIGACQEWRGGSVLQRGRRSLSAAFGLSACSPLRHCPGRPGPVKGAFGVASSPQTFGNGACPKVPEIAAIGSRGEWRNDAVLTGC